MRDPRPPKEAPPLAPGEERLELFEGKVVDLEARRVLHVLDKDRPSRHAVHGGSAYLLAKSGELRAYDLRSGDLRWSTPSAPCSLLAASGGGAFCGKDAGLVRFGAAKGLAAASSSKSTADLTQLLAVGGRVLAVRSDRSIESYDGVTGALVSASTLPAMLYGSRAGLVATPTGACGTSPSSSEVQLVCVDTSAKVTLDKTYPLRKPGDPSSLSFLTRQLDARWLVVSTWFGTGTPRRGIVVRLADGVEVARLEEEIVAAVSGPSGGLDGLLVTHPTVKLLEPSGAVRWTSTEKLSDAATTVLVGQTLVVASFHPIATGADLHGFDRATGKTLWRGDVELLPIGHSKYFNHVELSLSFGHVVMRGTEAAQRYLEVFDPKDGTRKFSEVDGT